MRIVVTGQADIRQLADLLEPDVDIPAGQGGIPPIHEIRMLLERGHEVILVTLDPNITDVVVLHGDHLTIHIGPCRAARGVRDLFRPERQWLAATLRTLDPDVVHAHWTYEYALAALDSGYPVVVTMHDAALWYLWWNLPQHSSGPLSRRLARAAHWSLRAFMAWRVARKSRFNIAVSPHTKDHFERILRCRGEVEVVPNLMNPELWRTPASSEPTVWDPASRPFRCVSVLGTWGDVKNGSTLLEAFALVRVSGSDARLALVGGDYGPHGEAARWAREHDLAAGVDFIGRISNHAVADLLDSADLMVHPSREESCAMVVAEAQLASTAVIGGSMSGGIPWSLGYGDSGVLVDIESVEELADAIIALAIDSDRRAELARAGRSFALRRYDPTEITDRIENALQRCVEHWTAVPAHRTRP